MDHELPEIPSTSIDHALAEASAASQASVTMKNFSVRLPEDMKEAAQYICERNATDLGTFLRECTRALVADYGLPVDEE